MSYKGNLEEKQEVIKYRSQERWIYRIFFLFASLVIVFLLSKLVGANISGHEYLYRVPFSKDSRNLDILLLLSLIGFYFWSKGTKRKALQKLFIKIPYIGKTMVKGKENELEDFFYPKVEFSDGIKRGKGLYYFKGKRYDIFNMFDFGKYSKTNGTRKIIALFRDKEQEELIKSARSLRPKRAAQAKKKLEAIKEKSKKEITTSNQDALYMDLFLMLEGIYNSYKNDFGDQIFIDHKMKSPLKLYRIKGTNRIAKIETDESIDVFRDSKVYFSIDMIMDTVSDLTRLYIAFLEKRLERGRFKGMSKSNLERFEMFFKFFMLRRILLNYSNIPSGWLCVKIEDYTMRAIASNIDRPMIIDINDKNNGSTPAYNSDVEATQFLFTYWAFMNENRIKKVIESLDFIYEASKEVKEINARKVAQKAMQEIEKEHKETYDAMKDEDLVILPPKEEM